MFASQGLFLFQNGFCSMLPISGGHFGIGIILGLLVHEKALENLRLLLNGTFVRRFGFLFAAKVDVRLQRNRRLKINRFHERLPHWSNSSLVAHKLEVVDVHRKPQLLLLVLEDIVPSTHLDKTVGEDVLRAGCFAQCCSQ